MLIIVSAFMLLLIFNSQAAAAAAYSALGVCAKTIIPSLFPFFVLSMLLSRLGLAARLSKIIRLRGASAFLMGITGGYPLGAAAVAQAYKNGELSEEEAELLLPCCNNSGPAFIIGAVGTGVFASVKLGVQLYIVHILSALILWAILGFKKAEFESPAKAQTLAEALPESVKAAVGAVLNVCGFVVFFTVLAELIKADAIASFFERLGLFDAAFIKALLAGLLEIGSSVSALAALPTRPETVALAAFILGFGGLSVQCQTAAIAREAGIRLPLHFTGRLMAASTGAVIMYFLQLWL